MSLLRRGSRLLDRKLQSGEAQTFRIWRGAASVEVSGVMSTTNIGFALDGGVTQSWQTTDLLVPVTELVLGGHQVAPEAGMRVEATINGQLVRYIVVEADDNRTHRWVDGSTREQYRIHMREGA